MAKIKIQNDKGQIKIKYCDIKVKDMELWDVDRTLKSKSTNSNVMSPMNNESNRKTSNFPDFLNTDHQS